MEAAGKTAIIVAIIAAAGGAIGALINMAPDLLAQTSANTPAALECPSIPPSEDNTPAPRRGFVWSPADFRLTPSGQLERQPGHWERARAQEHTYVPGHWDPSKDHCVWIPGDFVPVAG
jgi:hypothetical protein